MACRAPVCWSKYTTPLIRQMVWINNNICFRTLTLGVVLLNLPLQVLWDLCLFLIFLSLAPQILDFFLRKLKLKSLLCFHIFEEVLKFLFSFLAAMPTHKCLMNLSLIANARGTYQHSDFFSIRAQYVIKHVWLSTW